MDKSLETSIMEQMAEQIGLAQAKGWSSIIFDENQPDNILVAIRTFLDIEREDQNPAPLLTISRDGPNRLEVHIIYAENPLISSRGVIIK